MSDIITKIVIVLVALVAAAGAKHVLQMKNDNPVEEIAEVVIKDQTGYSVDLSPQDIDGSVDSVNA